MTRPYPFDRLPRVSHEEQNAVRRCARALPPGLAQVWRAPLESLLDAQIFLRDPALHHCAPGGLSDAIVEPAVLVVLCGQEPGARLGLEFEPALAAGLLDRLLGGDGKGAGASQTPLRDVERGVLAWGVARLLSDTQSAWRVGTVVTGLAAAQHALGDLGSSVWGARLGVGDAFHGVVRLWVPDHISLPAPGFNPAGSRAVRSLELTFALEAGRVALAPDAIAGLGRGDIVLFDESWPETSGHRLRAVGAERTRWWCRRHANGFEVTSSEPGTASPTGRARVVADRTPEEKKAPMDDKTLESVGDAPIELTIEIARFAMTLEEVSKLQPGEVLAAGRAVGERVVLRAGEKRIAEGELVDVDGEVGIRLLQIGGAG
jgi:flagellar motor switch protein FliM